MGRSKRGSVKKSVRTIPIQKRVHTNTRFKKLWLEQRLLGWKCQIYKAESQSLPMEVSLMRHLLELTDKPAWEETSEERAESKREQIEALLYISLYTQPIEAIRGLIDRPD